MSLLMRQLKKTKQAVAPISTAQDEVRTITWIWEVQLLTLRLYIFLLIILLGSV